MLFHLYANQEMGRVEKISGNAVIVFEAMKQLMALKYIEITTIDDERYTVLYHKMILQQIPLFITSKRTLSRAISELKEAELLKYNGNNMQPAYTFTDKAIAYITNNAPSGKKISLDSNSIRKKPLFSLGKAMRVESLSKEYFLLLRTNCLEICQKENIPEDEFDKFLDWHASKGSTFKNWLSAFRLWKRNYKKFNPAKNLKPNGGDSGGYSLDGMDL